MSVLAVNSNPSTSSFQQGLVVGSKTVSEAEGMRYMTQFANATIDFTGALLSEMPVGLGEFNQKLQDSASVLSFFNILYHIRWWMYEKRKSWQHTASMVFFTAQQCIGCVQFLEKIKAIGKIGAKIGHVPVFGTILSVCNVTGSVFGAWHDGRTIRQLSAKIQQDTKALVEAQANVVACNVVGVTLLKDGLVTQEEKEQVEKISTSPDSLAKFAKEKWASRVTRLKVEVENSQLTKKKTWISIAGHVATFALGVLTLIGLLGGFAALSATGFPLLALALIVSGLCLYEYWYDKYHGAAEAPDDSTLVKTVNALMHVQA